MVSMDTMVGTSVTDRKSGGLLIHVKRILFLAGAATLLFTMFLALKPESGLDIFRGLVEGSLSFGPPKDDDATTIGGWKSSYPDRSMGGLLPDFSTFEPPDKCASRGHRSSTKPAPTPNLIQRLREYEALHRRCASQANKFNNTIVQLSLNSSSSEESCRFVVWIADNGWGNRLLSLVSTFVYALLTNRVLLLHRGDMGRLFCEPFPDTSWLVPQSFPQSWFKNLSPDTEPGSQHQFGKQFNTSFPSPAFSYVNLAGTYYQDDEMFFCDQGQEYLSSIPWLFMKSNNYFIPGLYFLSTFSPQLDELFPDKEAIFHILGNYLFHPSDRVWGWINRFRNGYLANSAKQVGIQVRTFYHDYQPNFQEQLTRCYLENKVLPNLTTTKDHPEYDYNMGLDKVTSVLVTSLQPDYYENITDFYMSAPTEDGQVVSVHQPSHDGLQLTGRFVHDVKALAEIYLLSYSDVLITSGKSTFGYVAQGLGGVKPWILFKSWNINGHSPPCTYARSIEPCFHSPPRLDCKRTGVALDPAKQLPFVQTCEDIPEGVKLVEPVN
ncbi:unnamed protein product [Calypogeia fissa]